MRRAAPLPLRWALYVLPPAFRARHGEDLLALYADLARARGPGAAFWAWALADLLASGLLERGRQARARARGLPRRLLLAALRPLVASPHLPAPRSDGMLAGLWKDLTFGARTLARSPGFTAVILLTLALGIGANTAIFSVLHGVLMRPLPYVEGERLLHLEQPARLAGVENAGFSPTELADYRARLTTVTDLVEYHSMPFSLAGQGEPQRVQAAVVSARFFDVLGVRPLLGRTFAPEEDAPGAPPVLLLSHTYWQRVHGGDPSVVGRTFDMNGRTITVIGVLPPVPQYPAENDVYLPTSACPFRSGASWSSTRNARGLTVLARLAPGASLEAARAELAVVASTLHREYPEAYPAVAGFGASASRLQDRLVAGARPTLLLLLAAGAFLLLIVCANMANLTLARLARREHELVVRAALGASRGRLVRQLVTEHLLLSLAGGALGVGLASSGLDVLVAYAARFTPRAVEVQLDTPSLLFALAVSLGVGLLLAALPVLPTRLGLGAVLRAGGATAGPASGRLRGIFIASQVAVACVLLVGAGLMLRSLVNLQRVDPGFDPQDVLTARVDLAWDRYNDPKGDKVRAFVDALVPRLQAQPGVLTVGVANAMPLGTGTPFTVPLRLEGQDVPAGQALPQTDLRNVSSGYFHTLGVPLVRGRLFEPTDAPGAPEVAVVNQAFARQHLGGADAVGRRLTFDNGQTWVTVVGVVGDVRERGLHEEPPAEVYRPFALYPFRDVRLLVRTRGDPAALATHVRALVRELDAAQPVTDVHTLDAVRAESLAAPRLVTLLLGLFAAVALVLTVGGLAGVVAYTVSQRLREIGIRMALGAEPAAVLALVLRQGMGMVAVGLAVGVAGAFAVSRLLEGLLFDVTVTDPLTFGAAVLVLGATGLLACLVPARRATRVDPTDALRGA